MGEQTTVYSYNGILFHNKATELLIHVTALMNLKKFILSKKKPYTKECTMYNPICMNTKTSKITLWWKKMRRVIASGKFVKRLYVKETREFFGIMIMFHNLTEVLFIYACELNSKYLFL